MRPAAERCSTAERHTRRAPASLTTPLAGAGSKDGTNAPDTRHRMPAGRPRRRRRNERRRSPISLPPLPEPAPHLLRVLEGAVIDFPAPVLRPDAQRWAATCWPDPTQPGGWGRAMWWPSPYHRGYVPVALDYADVVEFGADIPIRHRRITRWVPVRWYGVVIERAPRTPDRSRPVSNRGRRQGRC